MASIQPIVSKDGIVRSYRIKVYRGKNEDGKQLIPYSMNWKVPEGFKSEKKIQNELRKVAGAFEAECKKGTVSIDRRRFGEYCEYYINLEEGRLKPTTISFYKRLLPVIKEELGDIKLNQLGATELNKFYKKLETDVAKKKVKAVANDYIVGLKKERKVKHKEVCEGTGLSDNTIRLAFQQKNISIESAKKIADYFGLTFEKAFDTTGSEKGLSPKYIRHYHNFIHTVLENAVMEGCVARNVADCVKVPPLKSPEMEFFDIDEILQIKSALDTEPLKYKVATYLLIATGMRKGELIGLKWKSFDFDNATVTIENNAVYVQGKGIVTQTPKNNNTRTLNFAPELIPILKLYQKEQELDKQVRFSSMVNDIARRKAMKDYNSEGYLFIQESGSIMSPNSINEWMLGFSKKVGLHVYPHKFRHSQATILIGNNIDVVTVSKVLGHAQVSTTQNIYAHVLERNKKEASDKIASLLFKNA